MNAVIRCSECSRRLRNPNADNGWNVTVKAGAVVGYLCPDCQTPEQNAEAVTNLATLDYLGADDKGLLRARPKGDAS